MRPKGSGGAWASTSLVLLDNVPALPASHRLASVHTALGTRHILILGQAPRSGLQQTAGSEPLGTLPAAFFLKATHPLFNPEACSESSCQIKSVLSSARPAVNGCEHHGENGRASAGYRENPESRRTRSHQSLRPVLLRQGKAGSFECLGSPANGNIGFQARQPSDCNRGIIHGYDFSKWQVKKLRK
jgi:hypothetical protein